MSIPRHHAEWLSLVEQSGPFLSMPVLLKRFNTGLEAHDPERFRTLRMAYEEWEDKWQDPAIHNAWIRFVLGDLLEMTDEVLAEGQAVPQSLAVTIAEHAEILRPDFVVHEPKGGKNRMLIRAYPATQDLEKPVAGRTWKASPSTRMMELLHGTGVRLGLVTNGEHWMLVDAPKGETTGFASWYGWLWLHEPITLRAFRSLLSAERFFGVPDDQTLEAMLAESAENQQEVTDQLGYQVRSAVEILVQSLDRADQDHSRKLLEGVDEPVLYEAALTVMMRLVFLFCAEERKLLPDDEFYTANYSVSSLGKQLRETSDQHGEEILERRHDAWSRLLATFRAVHGGASHDRFNLPAYGGHLFDPDRFNFLEGRKPKTSWRDTPADPLPVDNRTVLHLLEALQLLEMRIPGGGGAERRRLSFRALDIEQIGHVYEGLLDHTAKRAPEPVLGLAGAKDKEPEIPLSKLEELSEEWGVASGAKDGGGATEPPDKLVEFLQKETARSRNALVKALTQEELATHHSPLATRFQAACGGDHGLWERVKPLAGLVRNDTFGRPVVIPQGSVYVTAGTDRRTTGTHYTPRSLTEPIVQYTLEPLVYEGPAEGWPKEKWRLRSARELLDLNICDMACGSGAFLVQACRYMSERLMEAWEIAEGRVARGEGRGGDDDRNTLSGVEGVGSGDDTGGTLLPGDKAVPQGGNVRDDQPDTPGGRLDSREPGGGAWKAKHEGVPQFYQHRQGITDGSGNASATEPSSWTAAQDETGRVTSADRRNQPDAQRSSQQPPTSEVTPHPSSLAPRPSPRITPYGEPSSGKPGEMLIPKDPDERVIYARRIVAGRCLYGVDKNPLACEMAKLSLWLLTLAKDMPFTFLDHAIRCGDSLVGISSTEQLERFSLGGGDTQLEFAHEQIRKRLDATQLLRRQIEERFDSTVEDTEQKALMLKNADEQTRRLAYAADRLIATYWQPVSEAERERELSDALRDVEFKFKDLPVEELHREAAEGLRSVGIERTFQWPLEFPEVFDRGGFDAIVGNPPFMHGSRIAVECGQSYSEHLRLAAPDARGKVNLVVFFLRRALVNVRPSGGIGLVFPDSIVEGADRITGPAYAARNGFQLCNVQTAIPWPGDANLRVSRATFVYGTWRGDHLLNDANVTHIDSRFTSGVDLGSPHVLATSSGMAFLGVKPDSLGFVLEVADAHALLRKCPDYERVLRPYFNGVDLNSHPTHTPPRYVIDFTGLSLEEAAQFADLFQHVERHVKPTCRWKKWWLFNRPAAALIQATAGMDRFLASARVTKHLAFQFVPCEWVLSDKVVAIPRSDWLSFAVLSSSTHVCWADALGTRSMAGTFNYQPTDCIQTMPFLLSDPPNRTDVDLCASSCYEFRQRLMLDREEGLTKTYNHFHDFDETAADIQKLRELHVEMDNAVAAAYGWTDLDLGHGFHETKQGIRYTISEPARREVLQRLLKLNHERYEEEVRQGLHEKKGKAKKATAGQPRSRRKKAAAGQKSLFDTDDDDDQHAPAKAGKPTPKTHTTAEPPSPNLSPEARGDKEPLRIEEYETDEVMAAFRQAARGRGWMDREELLRQVLGLLGYQRLGPHKKHTLQGHLRAAIRRKIIEADGDAVRLCTPTMADYTLEELRATLCSVMRKGTNYDREEVIHAVAHHLGFTQVREKVRQPIKSAINSAIRQGILGYEGNVIWREA